MVTITGNWIIVDKSDPSYAQLSINLVYIEREKRRKVRGREIRIPPQTHRLYEISNDKLYIPCGVLSYIKDYLTKSDVIYEIPDSIDMSGAISNIDKYENILDGISLRKYQIIALRKILHFKRCLIQMSTGSGKTEVLCALSKIIADVNNGYMTTLLIEPTVKLVDDTARRFENYGIPVAKYSENREIIPNVINISHPASLGNDLEKDKNLLNGVQVLLADETHHLSAESFRRPTYSMNNLQYSVGVSASAISQYHVGIDDISKYTYDEALVIGSTGPLVVNVTSKNLIESGSLANPVLLMLDNPADEPMRKNDLDNWTKILSTRLESEHRTKLAVDTAKFFHEKGRKTLILVRTKKVAEDILRELYKFGLGEYTRASFGGGIFEGFNGAEIYNDNGDVFSKFGNGEYTILIGTSHLYEGVDVPNLDVIVLACGGKGERTQVQGIGRALRKTKSGKYAYIVDFTDTEDAILSRHSRMRMNRYVDIIGVPKEHIYKNISVGNLEEIFNSLEV